MSKSKRSRPDPDSHVISDRDEQRPKKKVKYSTRQITWKEQKSWGGEFAAVGKGSWPVSRIIREKGFGVAKEYLVEWKPSPSNEQFEPTWVSRENVTKELLEDHRKAQLEKPATAAPSRRPAPEIAPSEPSRARRCITRIPDSSETKDQSDADVDRAVELDQESTAATPAPDRELRRGRKVRIVPPPPPSDRSQFESLHSSQLTPAKSRAATGSSAWPSASSLPPTNQKAASQLQEQISSFEAEPSNELVDPEQSASFLSSSVAKDLARDIDRVIPETPQGSPAPGHRRLSSPFRAIRSDAHPAVSPQQVQPESWLVEEIHTVPDTFLHSESDSSIDTPQPVSSTDTARSLLWQTSDPSFKMSGPSLEPQIRDTGHDLPRSPLVNSMTYDDVESNDPIFPDESLQPTNGEATMLAPLPIQQSIEEESMANEEELLISKANSSQESLSNMREVETCDGVTIPVRPRFESHEYAIPLPAEGRVQSTYQEIVKSKKKTIERFINRKGAPGTSDISARKTQERIEMQDMLQSLHDTVTHVDLGLGMMPQTQYDLNPAENAAYAEYAGSKFIMLGCLIDRLKSSPVSIAVFAQEGHLQDLLEQYLSMKNVHFRHDNKGAPDVMPNSSSSQGLMIELLTTQTGALESVIARPHFIIAFDVSFSTADAKLQQLWNVYGKDIPIIHFLVTNSSEHVERCVPTWLTSNIRLKIVVRTTYLASSDVGVTSQILLEDTDGVMMDQHNSISDMQRALRKTPDRRISKMADILAYQATTSDFSQWRIDPLPELELRTYHPSSKVSRAASRTPQPRSGARSSAPNSRATTPISRKRLLDADSDSSGKRLRLTPVRDLPNHLHGDQHALDELVLARAQIAALKVELGKTNQSLITAQAEKIAADNKVDEWRKAHSDVLERYERNKQSRRELVKSTKKLEAALTRSQERSEKISAEKDALREQVTLLRKELGDARDALKAESGDIAALEEAREQARKALDRANVAEKSVASSRTDFEFLREQYQMASKQAIDLSSENAKLKEEVARLEPAASDRNRQLKAMDYQQSLNRAFEKADQFKATCQMRDLTIRKLRDDVNILKSRRGGVQTRGSSVQPPTNNSPAPRSRQASPASGHLANAPPSGSRASVLRNER